MRCDRLGRRLLGFGVALGFGGLLALEREDEPAALLRLVHLHVMARAREQEQLGRGQQLVKAPGDSTVQVGIGGAEHNADRTAEPGIRQ